MARAITTVRRHAGPGTLVPFASKYVPHQGVREMARRRRQMVKAKLKAETK